MNLWDTHMHCCYSGDSSEEPDDMITAAMNRGLSGMIFTDHLDWDYTPDPGLFDLDLPLYIEEMTTLANSINSYTGFYVGVGIELGLQPHLSKRHEQLLADHSFDQVIGSTHLVQGNDPYYDSFYEGKSPQEAYESYFNEVLQNIRSFDGFDTLGHLDYICRYGMRYYGKEKGACRYSDYASCLDEILNFVISRGKSLEVNTGSFRSDEHATDPNPSYEILRHYYDLGGRSITLGSDAHVKEHIGIAFEEVSLALKEIGFTEITYYLNRMPHTYPL